MNLKQLVQTSRSNRPNKVSDDIDFEAVEEAWDDLESRLLKGEQVPVPSNWTDEDTSYFMMRFQDFVLSENPEPMTITLDNGMLSVDMDED